MVLPVIVEVVAGQQREPARKAAARGAVVVAGGRLFAVREPGAKGEELQGAEQRGDDPEGDQTRLGDVQQVGRDIEDHGHHRDLAPGDVASQKGEVPTCKGLAVTVVKVGVFGGRRRGMVEFVRGQKGVEGEGRVEPHGHTSDEVVEAAMVRPDRTMHRVVSGDEEAGREIDHDEHDEQRGERLRERVERGEGEGEQAAPRGDDPHAEQRPGPACARGSRRGGAHFCSR